MPGELTAATLPGVAGEAAMLAGEAAEFAGAEDAFAALATTSASEPSHMYDSFHMLTMQHLQLISKVEQHYHYHGVLYVTSSE